MFAREVTIDQAAVWSLAAGRVTFGSQGFAGVVIARQVDGDVRVLMDWRGAIAFGAVVGAAGGRCSAGADSAAGPRAAGPVSGPGRSSGRRRPPRPPRRSRARASSVWTRCSSTTSAGSPSIDHHALLDEHRAVAVLGHPVHVVGHQHDGLGGRHDLDDPRLGLGPEVGVTGREHLVEQQDVRIDRGRDGEPQPRPHPGRVGSSGASMNSPSSA